MTMNEKVDPYSYMAGVAAGVAAERNRKHEYPTDYPPGTCWSVDEAWCILDTLPPGTLSIQQRSFLAGAIAGALEKAAERSGRR